MTYAIILSLSSQGEFICLTCAVDAVSAGSPAFGSAVLFAGGGQLSLPRLLRGLCKVGPYRLLACSGAVEPSEPVPVVHTPGSPARSLVPFAQRARAVFFHSGPAPGFRRARLTDFA